MGSADISQFVVTTADGTACEISTLKVRALFPHLPATFTGTSSNFWASSLLADLPVFPSLVCGSCSSGQGFAYSFLQIPPHDGHPCCSAMYFVVAYAYSGLTPVRARPWRANQKKACRRKFLRQTFRLFARPSKNVEKMQVSCVFSAQIQAVFPDRTFAVCESSFTESKALCKAQIDRSRHSGLVSQ